MFQKSFLGLTVVVTTIFWRSTKSQVEIPAYCTSTVAKTYSYMEQYEENYKAEYTVWCAWYSSNRCKRYEIRTRPAWRIQNAVKNVNVKSCCAGYKQTNDDLDNLQCTPICIDGCLNGICVAPGQCHCTYGHRQLQDTCLPICPDGCSHGECIAPGKCKCQPGYSFKNELCRPLCTEGCLHGECIAPGKCICYDGYALSNGICEPMCDNCGDGECVAPGMCYCREGYAFKKGSCVPNCDEPCINGDCIEPDVCRCHSGFRPDRSNSHHCSPVCEGCQNGECVAPGECACNLGYQRTQHNDDCLPVCSKLCQNSNCSEPDICSCWDGYIQNINDIFRCDPDCPEGCKNGLCSSPANCTCFDGFEYDPYDEYACLPICSNECVNADCSEPETCACWDGYGLSNNSNICIPHCSNNCVNSYCSEPDVCICYDGYEKNDINNFSCQPICSGNCENAICIQPENCVCKLGYERHAVNESCFPICNEECANGFCSEPETCKCFNGFSAQPKNSKNCLQSTCEYRLNTSVTSDSTVPIAFEKENCNFCITNVLKFLLAKQLYLHCSAHNGTRRNLGSINVLECEWLNYSAPQKPELSAGKLFNKYLTIHNTSGTIHYENGNVTMAVSKHHLTTEKSVENDENEILSTTDQSSSQTNETTITTTDDTTTIESIIDYDPLVVLDINKPGFRRNWLEYVTDGFKFTTIGENFSQPYDYTATSPQSSKYNTAMTDDGTIDLTYNAYDEHNNKYMQNVTIINGLKTIETTSSSITVDPHRDEEVKNNSNDNLNDLIIIVNWNDIIRNTELEILNTVNSYKNLSCLDSYHTPCICPNNNGWDNTSIDLVFCECNEPVLNSQYTVTGPTVLMLIAALLNIILVQVCEEAVIHLMYLS